jgi:hypothetical protein
VRPWQARVKSWGRRERVKGIHRLRRKGLIITTTCIIRIEPVKKRDGTLMRLSASNMASSKEWKGT